MSFVSHFTHYDKTLIKWCFAFIIFHRKLFDVFVFRWDWTNMSEFCAPPPTFFFDFINLCIHTRIHALVHTTQTRTQVTTRNKWNETVTMLPCLFSFADVTSGSTSYVAQLADSICVFVSVWMSDVRVFVTVSHTLPLYDCLSVYHISLYMSVACVFSSSMRF